MFHLPRHRTGFAWLELLLALAVVALMLQLWPAAGKAVVGWLDVRHWSTPVRLAVNGGVLAVLVAVRFGPPLWRDWRERRQKISAERARLEEAQKHKTERETIERMQQSRRRRIY